MIKAEPVRLGGCTCNMGTQKNGLLKNNEVDERKRLSSLAFKFLDLNSFLMLRCKYALDLCEKSRCLYNMASYFPPSLPCSFRSSSFKFYGSWL